MKSHFSLLIVVAMLTSVPLHAVTAADSRLGTPAALAEQFSRDYEALVAAALPSITASELTQLLHKVDRADENAGPIKIDSLGTMEKLFGMPPVDVEKGQMRVNTERAAYSFDPVKTRMYVTWHDLKSPALTREKFAKVAPAISRAHATLMRELGVDPQQVFFVDFRENLSQATANPNSVGAINMPIMREGGTTLVLRAIAGLQVENSMFLASSLDAEKLEFVRLEWPRVKLSPHVWQTQVMEPRQVAREIVDHIAENAGQKPVNVRMAVVLRDVMEDGALSFVPALRVGVHPQPVATREGVITDAGEVFYIDLVRGVPSPEADNVEEEPASGQRPIE